MRLKITVIILVLLACLVIYWPGLNGPYVFDDTENLASINDWLNGHQSWQWVIFSNASGFLGRPISMATFVLNVHVMGPETWSLKFGNVLIHLVMTVAVFFLIRKLLTEASSRIEEKKKQIWWLSIFGAAFWSLSPLFVSTVLYVVQRMAMLSALFMVLAMISYLYGRTIVGESKSAWRTLLVFVVTPFFAILAIFSKENGVLALPLCGMLEWLITNRERVVRNGFSRAFISISFLLPAAIVVGLALSEHQLLMEGYNNRPFDIWERLLTQSRVLGSYVSSFFLPFGPRLGLYHDDYVLSKGLFNPLTTLVAVSTWVLVLFIGWRLRHRSPGIVAGLGIYFIGHATESSVFPLLLYFEHRNYFPAIGLTVLLLTGIKAYLDNSMGSRLVGSGVVAVLALGVLLVFSFSTFARSVIWSDMQSIIAQGIRFHPESKWARIAAAQYMMQQSPPDISSARMHLSYLINSADRSTQRIGGAWRVLADCSIGDRPDDEHIDLAFGGNLNLMEADALIVFDALATGVMTSSCNGLGVDRLAKYYSDLADKTTLPATTYNIRRLRFLSAQAYAKAGKLDDAIRQASIADTGTRKDAPMGVFLAELYLATGRYADAQTVLDRVRGQLAEWDETGRQFVQGVQARLDDLTNP